MIQDGRVTVNGRIVTTLGTKVDAQTDRVAVDGKPVTVEKKVYLVINKPPGVVCTNEDTHGRKRVLDLLPSSLPRLYSVGRLDYLSEGLLLLTNDGSFSLRLTHPRYKMPKVYRVEVAGRLTHAEMQQLRQGIASEGEWLHVEEVTQLRANAESTELQIVLREGKNRQIRRMLAALGHSVRKLVRTAIGDLRLNNLKPGQWRNLSDEEVRMFQQS